MKQIKTTYPFLIALLLTSGYLFAQLSPPQVEDVYGGRILAINGYAKTADSTLIYISTESANSIFYTTVYSNSTSPTFNAFKVMPGVDANAGYGAAIRYIDVNELSGSVFFVSNSQLLSSDPSSSTVNSIYSADVNGLLIESNYLFFTESGRMHFGTIDASDNFTEDLSSPLALPGVGGMNTITIDPTTNYMYVFSKDITPVLLRINSTYTTISGGSTVTDISPSTLSTATEWTAFNIAPDGTFYMMGHQGQDKYCAYSTDHGATWSEYAIGIGGISGDNIAFAGTSAAYVIYTANAYNNANGDPAAWYYFGNSGLQTHPNDGWVFTDPINDNIVYLTTDQGIGASVNQGSIIFEIDDGVEAVQVEDFSMTSAKYTAWTASKSGIRRVDNYQTSPTWTNAIFPNGDGSPYHCIDMGHADSNVVYAGNLRIYKSTDNGSTWRRIFSPEDPPYNFPHVEIFANAVKECPWNHKLLMAGWEMQEPARKGGVFFSNDSGATWEQVLLEASSIGEDVDVTDIAFNLEGSDTVAYVSVKYDLAYPQGYSIYRLVRTGSIWTPLQDMTPSNTSVGYAIVASLLDIQVSVTGDTVFTVGTDAGNNHPTVYYKDLTGTGLWTPLTVSGFPSGNEEATAVTIGGHTLYAAVDADVYYLDLTSPTSWTLGFAYPVGTRINFLYYDDLLVGTSLGLFGHPGANPNGINDFINSEVNKFQLMQNYPNPFNPTTVISYAIPKYSNVTLSVYNLIGQKVATLVNKQQAKGRYSVNFNAKNLSSGIYIYKLQTDNLIQSKKMMLLK